MIYNNKFVSNHTLTVHVPRWATGNGLMNEYSDWGFAHRIRMKVSNKDLKITVYFEDDMDMAAFKLKFGV